MAGRVHTMQNGLWILSSVNPIKLKSQFFRRSLHFRSNPRSSSPSRAALFCSCSQQNEPSSDAFVLTTPLYYVNAPPHMGSAYTTIAADAIARFQRLLGKKVIFVTGTDEHGEKIATAAAAAGSTPSEHCDAISQAYKALWKEDKKELIDDNSCSVHLKPCVSRREDNYFFALSKYQKQLEDFLTQNPSFVQPSSRLNEVQAWVKTGLKDFSISRATVNWGIRVPNDHKQTIYVWFDALLGYISALLENEEPASLENAVGSSWPASLHLIGKDILRFHAVYWPAMLMSAGLTLPKMVFGHGFLTKDGMKMGKSLGNTIEPNDLVQRFGADAVRYFFLREVEFGGDGDYSEERFINIVNAHLANTIGNLLNRTLGLLKKYCQSTLVIDSDVAGEGSSFRMDVEHLVEKASMDYANLSISSACEAVLDIGNAGNAYMDERAPWSLFKQGGAAAKDASKDLVVILEAMRIIAVALSPISPSLCQRIYSQLGFSEEDYNGLTWSDTKWGGLKAGQVMSQPQPVFARIEPKIEREDAEAEAVKKIPKKKGKKVAAQFT